MGFIVMVDGIVASQELSNGGKAEGGMWKVEETAG